MKGVVSMASDFGSLLRDLREKARVGLGTLAKELGISAAYLSDVERGYRAPFTRDKIIRIGEFLAIDPTGLIVTAARGRGYYELPMMENPAAQTVGAALMRGWPSLNDDDLEKIKKILEGVNYGDNES
jgi:transcriptional regulator with XRE-family HTH domain